MRSCPTALQFRHYHFPVKGHELPKDRKFFALQAGDEGGQSGVEGTDALTVVEPVIEEALYHLSGLILVDFHDDRTYGLRSAARPTQDTHPEAFLYNHSGPRTRGI
jgi:hypothetical protein